MFQQKAKEYWDFLRKGLVSPASFSATTNRRDALYGLITLIILCLMQSLTVYMTGKFLFNRLFSNFFGPLGSLFGNVNPLPVKPGVGALFFQPLLVFLLVTAIMIAALSVGCLVMRSERDWHSIVARFGSFAAVPAALFALAFLFAAIQSFTVVIFLSGIGVFMLAAAIAYTLKSFQRSGREGFDLVHAALITYAIILIGAYIVNAIIR